MEQKKSIKGMRIRTVNYSMIAISSVLYVLLIVATINASKEYKTMVTATDEYIDSQSYAAQIADGSNYLTEQNPALCDDNGSHVHGGLFY